MADGSVGAEVRPFDTLEQMNDAIVDGINSVLGPNDIAFCLGDWSFGGYEQIYEFRKRLHVLEVHLIYGNHDEAIEKSFFYQSLFTSVSHYQELKIDGQSMVLSHYPMRVWNKSHKGWWQLYGHCHGSLPDQGGKQLDVAIEKHNYRPWTMVELHEYMADRPVKIRDHHGVYVHHNA